MTIAEKIKESRLKLGLTQQEVSEKLFVTRQTISNWENNRSTPDIDTLIKLSDLYQIDLESLLKPEQLADEPERMSEEKKPTFRLPLYLLNLTAVVACVFTDFFTPTGTMTLWTAAAHFLLLVNFVLIFGFFLTKKRPLPAKTIVFALGKGLMILAIILGFTLWSNKGASADALHLIGHNYGHFIYLTFKAIGVINLFDWRKFEIIPSG